MKKLMLLGIILSLGVTSYSEGLQLNLGYDVWRSLSKTPNHEGAQMVNYGQPTIAVGGEYIWDYGDDVHYGLGAEYRSRLESRYDTYNESVPVYMVGKFDILNDQLYLVGRAGYNFTSSSTDGGYYVAMGIGKEISVFNIELLYEKMGYTFKGTEDIKGNHDTVGIKFGFKLGDIYDALTGNSTQEASEEPVLTSTEEVAPTTGVEETQDVVPMEEETAPTVEEAPVVTAAVISTESSSSEDTTIHKVEEGDTLYKIGLEYNMTWDKISEANDLSNPDQITPEEELEIPSKK